MSEWELEFSVLFLLGLWTCEMLKVSEKIFRSSLKRGLRNNRYPPDSPDAAFEPTVISRLAPISPILVRRFLAVLDRLEVIKLAVSLGGTETLASHPASMTHSDIPPEEQLRLGITQALIHFRLGRHLTGSAGVEADNHDGVGVGDQCIVER